MRLSPDLTAALSANVAKLHAALAEAFEPSVQPEICKWAEESFRLSATDSASPGLVTLEPWQRAILSAWQNPANSVITLAGSSQIGKSLLDLIILAYAARHRPGPIRVVSESDVAAARYASTRIGPAVRDNLGDLIPRSKIGRGSATSLKLRNATTVTIVGAQTPAGLSSAPVKTIIATEVRGFPASAGKDGDPVGMMLARLKSFGSDGKAFLESSPGITTDTTKDRLTELFEDGDQRRWHVACPHCEAEHPLAYAPQPDRHTVHFTRSDGSDAQMQCCECGVLWSRLERIEALHGGRYIATANATTPGHVSFHYSELESVRSELDSIVRRVEASKRSIEKQITATNTILGQPFNRDKDAGLSLPDDALQRSIRPYSSAQLLPRSVLLATAGIDVQPDRLEGTVLGHGRGKNRWVLTHKVFPGDPNGDSVWAELAEFLSGRTYKHPSGATVKIRSACIDSGGHNTQAVYAFAADNLARGRLWYAIKGVSGNKPVTRKSTNTALRKQTDHKLILIGVDVIKSLIFDAFNAEEHDTENRIFLPEGVEQSYVDGLFAESKVISSNKKGETVISFAKRNAKARNEPLDCLVYAVAAYSLLNPSPDFAAIERSLDARAKAESEDLDLSSLRKAMGIAA